MTKYKNVQIDEDFHYLLKLATAKNGEMIRPVIHKFIIEYAEKSGLQIEHLKNKKGNDNSPD